MKRFAALDATTSTNEKLETLIAYFSAAEAEEAAWASYFLAGGKPRQSVPTRLIGFARERAGLPEWLFEESYQAVGDLAETIAHVLPPATRESELGLAQWIEERVCSPCAAPILSSCANAYSATGTNSTGASAFADQTHRRRLLRGCRAATGRARTRGSRGRRLQAHCAVHGRLDRFAAGAERCALSSANRTGGEGGR